MERVILTLAAAIYLCSDARGQMGENEIVLNPNLAAVEQLLTLDQLDSALVEGIKARRPFPGMAAFDAYLDSTLADSVRAELYLHLFLPIELNSASEEDILTIPGVGRRMAHEFEEYRPYKSMDHWRREIGKYVDDKELARLERYVFLKE